jgi:hypothetical protein
MRAPYAICAAATQLSQSKNSQKIQRACVLTESCLLALKFAFHTIFTLSEKSFSDIFLPLTDFKKKFLTGQNEITRQI